MPTTPLCGLLGIDQPILSVGFGAGAGPELVAAVSNAGGLGVLGCSGQPEAFLRERIAATRDLTDRPFGANVIIARDETEEDLTVLREHVGHILSERVPLLVLFAGDPSPFVADAHANGVLVFVQVGSVEEALAAATAGVDGVIAQGVEAGGHVTARHSLLVTLPAIVDAVAPLPVLASGGIADGRGVAAALALGAQGVSLGTRFVAADEAFVPDEYKRRIVGSRASDTHYSGFLFDVWWPDFPHRTLKSRGYHDWVAAGMPPSGSRPGEGETIGVIHRPWGDLEVPRWASQMLTPWFEGDIELAPMWAGESVELVQDVLPAGEIVRRIAREADEAIGRLARPVENL